MEPNLLPRADKTLVSPEGLVRFGNFAGPVEAGEFQRFDYSALSHRPFARIPWLRSRYLKRWQFVGVIDEDLIFGAAVAHVQYLGTGFAYAFDRKSRELTERGVKMPLAAVTEFSSGPAAGRTGICRAGKRIRMFNEPVEGERRLVVELGDGLGGEIFFREPGVGVSTACPQDRTGFHYTYKSAGLPARGWIRVGGKQRELGPGALALYDWTASTPARITNWNWAAGVGHGAGGETLGLNFSRGLVDGNYSQNAVWVNGIPTMFPAVKFDYDPSDLLARPWHLTTPDRRIDLTFEPSGERREKIDVKLIASVFRQPFGTFRGTVDCGEGPRQVELCGFCEEHHARW